MSASTETRAATAQTSRARSASQRAAGFVSAVARALRPAWSVLTGRNGGERRPNVARQSAEDALARRQEIRERRAADAAAAAASQCMDDMIAGASPEQALVDYVRRTGAGAARQVGRALAHRLYASRETRPFGALLMGVFLEHEEFHEAARAYFAEADPQQVKAMCPGEYVSALLATDPDAGRAAAEDFLSSARDTSSRQTQLELLKALIRSGAYDLALRWGPPIVSAELEAPTLPEAAAAEIRWLDERFRVAALPPVIETDAVHLAVMDYKMLDLARTSSNRGDYVQSLAAVSHVCRYEDVAFSGDPDLAAFLEELRASLPPGRRIAGPSARVALTTLDRDFASGRRYAPNTWLISNGWFMHRHFRGVPDFPYPDDVNPIFISFHVNDPGLLNTTTADYLKRFAPIGCRDWTTVYRLREFGVPAFFSGCLTTTVSDVLPPRPRRANGALAAVDVATPTQGPNKVRRFSQASPETRHLSLVDGMRDAKAMLEGYLPYERVETQRLHCYLPCRSMGVPVDFRPRNRADVRFEGLIDLDDAAVARMRAGIDAKLEAALSLILAGADRQTVMARWREVCAPDVADAERYCATYDDPGPYDPPIAEVLQAVRRDDRAGDAPARLALAFALDENLADQFPAVLQSVVDHTPAPIAAHVLYRGLSTAYLERLAAAFPEIAFDFLDFSAVDYGEKVRLLAHTTVSTMDRLFLPEALPRRDKVLYLDIDILARDDLTALFDIQLGQNVVAGKRTQFRDWNSAVRLATRATLSMRTTEAYAVRRRLHAERPLHSPTFNAGVILMNLSVMRAEAFTSRYLHLVRDCAFNDQDVLNVFAAGRQAAIDPAWNYVPNQDHCLEPKLIHWAGPNKPWGARYVPHQALFADAAARADARLAGASVTPDHVAP